MDLVERYNALLKRTEDGTITFLNRILDQAFNRLVRRVRIHMRAGYADPAQRNLALLQEFRQLIPAFRPDRIDAYDRLLRNLLQDAQSRGLSLADELTRTAVPHRARVDVSIPLEATKAAATQARSYLLRHGETFATTSAEVVAQGIAEGRPTDAMIGDLRLRLGVVKSRAETIVRTEALRAYADASNTYYTQQGIRLVMWYATSDDRTCPICGPRAGVIYKLGDVRVPCHPRCRCHLAPWNEDIATMDPDYAQQRQRHRKEVAESLRNSSITPASLNKAAVFEQLAPSPYA